MMEKGYVWILTDGITNFLSTLDDSTIDSMQGVLGVMWRPKTHSKGVTVILHLKPEGLQCNLTQTIIL